MNSLFQDLLQYDRELTRQFLMPDIQEIEIEILRTMFREKDEWSERDIRKQDIDPFACCEVGLLIEKSSSGRFFKGPKLILPPVSEEEHNAFPHGRL